MSSWSESKPQQATTPDRKSGVVVLPVDPYQVHIYWIIEPAELRETARSFGKQTTGPSPVLRFQSIPLASVDLRESDAFLDVPVDLDALNWYVYLPKPSRRYFVDLGLKAEDGRFSVLARSTIVTGPPASASDNDDETLMLVLGDCVFRDPPTGPREDQPPQPPTSNRPDISRSEETTGLDQTGSGTFSEHHLVEMNERSFASGLSSIQLGNVSPAG